MEEQKLLRRKRKAVNDKNDVLLAETCTDLANFYMDDGRYELAIDEYIKVAEIFKKDNRNLQYAIVNRAIGEAHLGLQNYKDALEHQKMYLAIAKELNNKVEEQRALATIGHTYLTIYLETPDPDKANLEQAYRFCSRSLKICQSFTTQATKLEIADMLARLYSNLGVIQDCLGNTVEAEALITKSINICKVNDLYEQLQRGYTSLASVFEKRGEHKLALEQHNLAVEVSKKLVKANPSLLSGALLSKSDVLIKLGDLHGAKGALKKAYNLKLFNVKDFKTIESNLKVVAAMTNFENQLVDTPTTDYAQRKRLYEKMGDGFCDLKCYAKAIDYYKRMLESATQSGTVDDSALASCYYSIAETYKDNGQYDLAVEYYETELNLCKNLKDSLNSLSRIVDTMESGNCGVDRVSAMYQRAIDECRREGDRHEEGRMVKRFVLYLKRQGRHSNATEWERVFEDLNYESTDSEGGGSSQPMSGSHVGDDVDPDLITDLSGESDIDVPSTSSSKPKRRTKNYTIKRNMKGETQLHTACINGRTTVVAHLLEQGHPVNARDHAGWLPIHEACICGHMEIVEMLLNKGADINDRGGIHCGGNTPLHDAASNGHMNVVQLLLSRGANPIARTDEGETVLQFFKKWRATEQLDEEGEELYQRLTKQIATALEKAGIEDRPASLAEEQPMESTSPRDLRRSKYCGLEEDLENEEPKQIRGNTSKLNKAASDYKNTIDGLRNKRPSPTQKLRTGTEGVAKRPALVTADEDRITSDDWLDDDVGRKNSKKRKTGSPRRTPQKRFSTDSSNLESPYYSPGPSTSKQSPANQRQSSMIVDDNSNSSIQWTGSNFVQRKSSKKRQQKLTAMFGPPTAARVEADSTSTPSTQARRLSSASSSTASSLRNCEFDDFSSTPTHVINHANSRQSDPTLSVDVRINEKLYRVPVLMSQVHTHTIKWLADEAATRYAKKEYIRPTLELVTGNGAILADDDLISLLFPMGTLQSEPVDAKIIKYSVPPLMERFREACQDMSIDPFHDEMICKSLEEISISLNLSNRGLTGTILEPLCRALNRQATLLELDLSGNFLSTESVRFLTSGFPSLVNLYKVNLSCTDLQSQHLEIFSKALDDNNLVFKVNDLDLSDNFLGDESLGSLSILTHKLRLKKLNLSLNKFTQNLFSRGFNKDIVMKLHDLEDFSISDNALGNQDLVKLVTWLSPSNVKSINLSRNSSSDGFLGEITAFWGNLPQDGLKLQEFGISRCHVEDKQLFDFLGLASNLRILDVSYNPELTSLSLSMLLKNSHLNELVMLGCNNIFRHFTEIVRLMNEPIGGALRLLKLSCDDFQNGETYLIECWEKKYGNRALVEKMTRFLSLAVMK